MAAIKTWVVSQHLNAVMDWDVHPRVAEKVRTTCFKWFLDIKVVAAAAQIEWEPYTRINEQIREANREQLDMRFARVPCICFATVAYHMPEICPRQLGIDEAQLPYFAPLPPIKVINPSSHKDIDWRTHKKYACIIESWANRRRQLIRQGDFARAGDEVDHEPVAPPSPQDPVAPPSPQDPIAPPSPQDLVAPPSPQDAVASSSYQTPSNVGEDPSIVGEASTIVRERTLLTYQRGIRSVFRISPQDPVTP
ncbi:hypothetical protein L484_010995 [Morus notabilis]|uniref:Aminotransferase-like plant mobile domain-containing protein n=1 Tax=Morus notabilis TaxID=981085 RepID=W9RET9_9ROSA|nr:hypothetical protein L484_010995 [Morus notabilis]